MITMPRDISNDDFKEIFPSIEKSTNRVSTHGFEVVNDDKDNGYVIKEVKSKLPNINQKGININVAQGNSAEKPNGKNGHILVGTQIDSKASGALVKLESAAANSTSIFGHEHNAMNAAYNIIGAGNTNKISATCQFREFSPHIERNGVLINLAGINSEELKAALTKFNEVYEKKHNDTEFLKELTGPKMGESQLKTFLNDSEENSEHKTSNDGKYNEDIIDNARKPLRFYQSHEAMKEISSLSEECGMMIFYNEKSKKYIYYISDEEKFEKFITNKEEQDQLKVHQLNELYLSSSMTSDYTCIQSISTTLYNKINKLNEKNKILGIGHLEKFKKHSHKNEEFLNTIEQQAKADRQNFYKIPGVTIYRYKGAATYYGYIIDNLNEFKTATEISDEQDIKKIIALQNWWFWTTGDKKWNIFEIKYLPQQFRNKIKMIKRKHTDSNHKSDYVIDVPSNKCGNANPVRKWEWEWKLNFKGGEYKEYRIFDDDDSLNKIQGKDQINNKVFENGYYNTNVEELLAAAGIK